MWCVRMPIAASIVFCIVSAGCQNGLKDENAALRRQNQELLARNADLQRALSSAPDPSQLQAKENEIAQLEARIRELQAQLRKPDPGAAAEPGIEGIQTSYDRRRGEMTVHLPSDILFEPGSAQIRPAARSTLDKVAAALRRDYAGKKIRVEGHTDSDPIVKTRDKWIDNLDLSLNRAAAVSRYLVQKGVDFRNIATAGYGDTRPKGTKDASRRVEIIVVVG